MHRVFIIVFLLSMPKYVYLELPGQVYEINDQDIKTIKEILASDPVMIYNKYYQKSFDLILKLMDKENWQAAIKEWQILLEEFTTQTRDYGNYFLALLYFEEALKQIGEKRPPIEILPDPFSNSNIINGSKNEQKEQDINLIIANDSLIKAFTLLKGIIKSHKKYDYINQNALLKMGFMYLELKHTDFAEKVIEQYERLYPKSDAFDLIILARSYIHSQRDEWALCLRYLNQLFEHSEYGDMVRFRAKAIEKLSKESLADQKKTYTKEEREKLFSIYKTELQIYKQLLELKEFLLDSP